MNLERFLELSEQLNSLGWSVVGQLKDVVIGGEDLEDQNTHALEYILDFLRECGDDMDVAELHDAIEEYLDNLNEE
jgi:hypothetical protein